MTIYNKAAFLTFLMLFISHAIFAGGAKAVIRTGLRQADNVARAGLRNVDNVIRHSGRYADNLARLGWRKSDDLIRVSTLHAGDLAKLSVRHGDNIARFGLQEGDDIIRASSKVRSRGRIAGSAERAGRIPQTDGSWSNSSMAGNSTWLPDMNRIPDPSRNPYGQSFRD
jgi:hypothetical protein